MSALRNFSDSSFQEAQGVLTPFLKVVLQSRFLQKRVCCIHLPPCIPLLLRMKMSLNLILKVWLLLDKTVIVRYRSIP